MIHVAVYHDHRRRRRLASPPSFEPIVRSQMNTFSKNFLQRSLHLHISVLRIFNKQEPSYIRLIEES